MTYDFLIIGGGIAGTSAGAALSRLGTTCLLEAESALAYHASGRSAALFEPNYGHPVTVDLSHASATALRTLGGGVLSPRGLLILAGPGEDAALARDIKTMDLAEISIADAQDMIPILNADHITRAAHHAAAWDIDTDRMVQHYARQIRTNGAVETGATVLGLTKTPQGWTVETRDHSFHARIIVNAAGAWADDIARMAGIAPIGLTPKRRSMARMPAPRGHDVSAWPMIIGAGESWYAKPDAGAWLVSPAEEDPAAPHDAYADDMVLAEGIARYQPFVTEEVTRVTSSWAGLRTFAPDRCLVIGPDRTDPSVLWFAGQGGYGFQTAPAASQLLADLVSGAPSTLDPATVKALSPSRF
ncbi:NAD(P)/FAD-dependent oxidoreductase [Jannaschia sp. CCS1]|uniref:NAD(P)/FAD-dependent oxidoreductase n=1 Tax=Jannaschia sp. (strain CCS1) TaxID=290400 RepID=UPI000053BBFC|nr:FAD-binding oxidoreductase [Jannaschia sp. CCS1]ABD53843.1 FAD dependent oxidoreductase [Jannaschia sp. CCS1]